MLYQRYFLRMNQSNMTHVLGLLAGLALALGVLLLLKLFLDGNQRFFDTLERPENLFLAITLITCVAIYAGKYIIPGQDLTRDATEIKACIHCKKRVKGIQRYW